MNTEQELRSEVARLSMLVNVVTHERDEWRANADALGDKLDQYAAANDKLGGQLLNASEERKAALAKLGADVEAMAKVVVSTVKQRDCIESALRALVKACGNMEASPEAATMFPDIVKPYSQAVELLTVIDQLKARNKAQREKEGKDW